MNAELPQGWVWAKMLDILDYEGGTQPPKKNFIYGPRKGYVRLLQIRDFGDKPFPTYVPDSKRLKKATSDDLLLARYGGSSASDSLGRICTGLEGAYNVALAKLIFPRDLLETGYVRYLFLGPWFRERITQNSRSCQTGFNREDVVDIQFPIAPVSEQRRIVAKLDGLLSQVDACRLRLARIPELLKRFRQSVLAAACSGRLTADWREQHPDTEPAKIKLADRFRHDKIVAANREAGFKKFRYKPSALIDLGNNTKGIDELFELPSTWVWASLGQLTWSVADGPHFSPKYVEKTRGVPFISGRNVSYEGLDFSDAKFVSRKDHEEFSKRARPLVGDVLLTKGGTTGIAMVVTQPVEFSVWVHVALLKVVDDLVTPFYLRDALSAPFVYVQSQAQTHGVGNQDLGLTRMVHMALPLPPLPEQEEAVRRVKSLFALVDRIEERFVRGRKRVDRFTQAILAKAFRGELVPTEFELANTEGRSFEPAEELLNRIGRNGNSQKMKQKAEPRLQGSKSVPARN